jgi:hypothetical protein
VLDGRPTTFHVLGFMRTLKAAREFGLDPDVANAIALRFDPRVRNLDPIVDDLAAALIEQGAVRAP